LNISLYILTLAENILKIAVGFLPAC